ncbi:MAG: N-acetylglutamate synthase [Thermoleophilaceae bacterium]|nr:N-acetylglutamate synthase [Thermoleophilaceae bacterium]
MSTGAADQVAAALVDTWVHLLDAHPDAWSHQADGVAACATGIPLPGLNGVWSARRDPDPAELERLLSELSARGLPHMLQLRPESEPDALAVPERLGLVPADDVPMMRLDDPALLDRAASGAPELDVRRIRADEGALHTRTVAAGFGEDADHFARLLPEPLLALDGVRTYVGEVDGAIVTTALGTSYRDYVGIFNVATPPDHRRRGYGAAITARVVLDGLTAGSSWAWLQSSEAGYRVYEALGFKTVERLRCWVRV